MSKIGRRPILVKEGITITRDSNELIIKGPKGELKLALHHLIRVVEKDNLLIVKPVNQTKLARSLHGTFARLIGNIIEGVTTGFTKQLEINGVGYKATLAGNQLVLNVGFSHPVNIDKPAGIEIELKKNLIIVSGIDKQLVGQVAADIRATRPPEPYKGKGIKYSDELIRRKAGKTAKAAGAAA